MKATSGSGSESRKKALSLTMDEDRIYDAEGVRVHVGDEIEMVLAVSNSLRRARVLEVRETGDTFRPATVVVGWNDDQRVGEIAPDVFNNFCRVLVSAGREPLVRKILTANGELAIGDELFTRNEFGTSGAARVVAFHYETPEALPTVEIKFGNGYVSELELADAEAAMRTPAAAVAGTHLLTLDRVGNQIRVGDDVRYILDAAPLCDEDHLRGRVFESKDGSLLVHWSDGSESVVTAADVRSKIVLVKSRS